MAAKSHVKSPQSAPSTLGRLVWLIIGFAALGCGAVGVVLPVLPTTPFVILAAFAFAKGSPRMRRWLIENRIFGPIIVDWEQHGAIARRYKIASCCIMAAVFTGSALMGVRSAILVVQALILCAAATYILTRPSARKTP